MKKILLLLPLAIFALPGISLAASLTPNGTEPTYPTNQVWHLDPSGMTCSFGTPDTMQIAFRDPSVIGDPVTYNASGMDFPTPSGISVGYSPFKIFFKATTGGNTGNCSPEFTGLSFSFVEPPPTPIAVMFTVPTSTASQFLANVSSTLQDPGLLTVIITAVSIPLVFYVAHQLIGLIPKSRGSRK